jgi:hydroxyacylglutathione hydrolase
MAGTIRRLRKSVGGVALLLFAGASAGAWWFLSPRQVPPPPVASSSAVLLPGASSLAPGLYLLGATRPAAAYAVDTSDGLVLIDSGLQASAETVTAQLAELHLDINRLRAVLLTHVHADHSLGSQRLREKTGAKIHAGRGDCPPLRRGEPREAFFATYHMPEITTHPTAVDVELNGDEVLSFGAVRIRVIATPGHTPGSVCYLLERPGLRALFTGDVVSCLQPAAEGALGTYIAHLPPLYRGNARDYLASLRRLRDLPVPDLVLPGHPTSDSPPQNPHLTPQRWQQLLDGGIAELERLLARYEADGADFLDGNPKELLPGLHYLGDCGQAIYCLDAGGKLLLFDAPGGPALVDFLARAFEKLGWAKRKVAAVLLTSADERATEGLNALVKASGCQVIAPKAALERIRRLCPADARILDEENLGAIGGFEGKVIALAGRGIAPLAYQLTWAGKTVLISGRIPVKSSYLTMEQLRLDLEGSGGGLARYRQTLDRLESLRPDVWLPALPVHGQNANLYDDDWQKILAANRRGTP